MPETLIESSTFDTDIVVPIGTDKRKAATVRVPFSSLTNRSKYLKDAYDGLLAVVTALSGVISNILNGTTRLPSARYCGVGATSSKAIADGNVFVQEADSITLTFTDTGAANGDAVEFCSAYATEMTLIMPAGTLAGPVTVVTTWHLQETGTGSEGKYEFLRFVRSGGVWRLTSFSRNAV